MFISATEATIIIDAATTRSASDGDMFPRICNGWGVRQSKSAGEYAQDIKPLDGARHGVRRSAQGQTRLTM